jgi:hypothetical protein
LESGTLCRRNINFLNLCNDALSSFSLFIRLKDRSTSNASVYQTYLPRRRRGAKTEVAAMLVFTISISRKGAKTEVATMVVFTIPSVALHILLGNCGLHIKYFY